MLITKDGYPEKSDIVICTVTKIQYNSIFVRLDEYDKKQGLIHISEISPGRIRNIRDYVKEGKVIVCVVLRVNTERDLIELSLRRVTEGQRRAKINSMKQEQKAEKLLEFVAKTLKKDKDKFTEQILDKVMKDYDNVHDFFEDVVTEQAEISSLNLPSETSKVLEETIRQRIKPPEVSVKGRFHIQSYESEGIEIIKSAIVKLQKMEPEDLVIQYLGAGKYDLSLVAEDYKTAEKKLDKLTETAVKLLKKKATITFERTDK